MLYLKIRHWSLKSDGISEVNSSVSPKYQADERSVEPKSQNLISQAIDAAGDLIVQVQRANSRPLPTFRDSCHLLSQKYRRFSSRETRTGASSSRSSSRPSMQLKREKPNGPARASLFTCKASSFFLTFASRVDYSHTHTHISHAFSEALTFKSDGGALWWRFDLRRVDSSITRTRK